MNTLIQPTSIILLFVLVRSGDLAIVSSQAHATMRALCYGIVAILALIVLILTFIH